MPFSVAEEYLCTCYRRAAERDSDATRRELRGAVGALVAALRELGSPPEKVALRIKTLLRASCPELIREPERFPVKAQLAEAAITWAMQDYSTNP